MGRKALLKEREKWSNEKPILDDARRSRGICFIDLEDKEFIERNWRHQWLSLRLASLSDGKTPYERRFGMPVNGPIIPFGAMVENHPISAKELSRLHQFGAKVLPGIFLGYA